MTFDIDTRALDAARAGLARFGEFAGDAAEPLLDEGGQAALDAVRSRAARHRQTGRMSSQIRMERKGDGIRHTVTVRAGGPIAPIVAGGSVAHDIKPIRGRALAMSGPVRQPFAARVRHPGTHADPFVAAGLEDAARDIDQAADVAADRLADRLADSMTRRA